MKNNEKLWNDPVYHAGWNEGMAHAQKLEAMNLELTLEEKIIKAKKLGITFILLTNQMSTAVPPALPLTMYICTWGKSSDEDFEHRLDLMIKEAEGLDHMSLLKKHGLI